MKAFLAALMGVSLVAGLCSPADAGSKAKKRGYAVKHEGRYHKPRDAGRGSDYYEHIADKLPFGSSIWWQQMNTERRGGRSG